MLRENLQDAADIIQNILSQPLAIPDTSSEINLIKAAQHYHPSQGTSSDLNKILSTFINYPAPTDRLIAELEIILKDLQSGT